MKPAAFEYHDPPTTAEACELLAQLGDEAKPLAGGQSLVPLMNMRLATPRHLIDLRNVAGLSDITISDTSVTMGSMTTQRQIELSPAIRKACPILTEATTHIAHFQIRQRGTIGGSIAHADPAAELPLITVLLDARIVARRADGTRSIPARGFFYSAFVTELDETEIVESIELPRLADGEGWAFEEFARRQGDFALVGVAATVTLTDGKYSGARLAVSGVASAPVLLPVAEHLVGERPSPALYRRVAAAVTAGLTPGGDIHATGEDRRDIAGHLTEVALAAATERALQLTDRPAGRR
ncbi:xanthine dehydrogenase family protein subunit M [Microbispora sp. H11081]|uniref:FAD binding domain-containing protein n=1 Tax=Microbispora sp. H11081 TaxID=2729107 RepID=UPI0014728167|nr:xanthine dehydrogenase family protein subunit M [Microbispora sp. H11081]